MTLAAIINIPLGSDRRDGYVPFPHKIFEPTTGNWIAACINDDCGVDKIDSADHTVQVKAGEPQSMKRPPRLVDKVV